MSAHPAPVRRAPTVQRTCVSRLAYRCAALVGGGLCAAVASAQTPSPASGCDRAVLAAPQNPYAYARRDDRCEGVYVQQVSASTGLQILSFIEAVSAFAIQPGDRLRLEWTGMSGATVRLRALSLRPKTYYRMDTERPPGTAAFDWPADIISTLNLGSQQIGFVGLMSQPVGDRTEEIYVPIRVGKGAVVRTQKYVVSIRPAAELSELFVTLTEVDGSGTTLRTIKKDSPLGLGFYPAETAIAVPLPVLERPGLYRLQLGATLSRGGSATRTLLFYHAGG
jgi:hypothetical protein